jgi:hypothetical protein
MSGSADFGVLADDHLDQRQSQKILMNKPAGLCAVGCLQPIADSGIAHKLL